MRKYSHIDIAKEIPARADADAVIHMRLFRLIFKFTDMGLILSSLEKPSKLKKWLGFLGKTFPFVIHEIFTRKRILVLFFSNFVFTQKHLEDTVYELIPFYN